jgi:hypothetical protein
MIQITTNRKFSTGEPTKLQVNATIANGSGSIWYKLLDANDKIVTEGNVPVGEDFALAYDGSEIMAGNYIAEYLSLTII